MSDDGVPAAGIVLLWPPVGLPTFVRFMYEQKTEMERLVALVQELGSVAALVPYPARLSRRAAPDSYRSDDPAGTTR
jgi:hypothetical protein